MRFLFKTAARQEFFEAIAWYETKQAGLGREFAREVIDALNRARSHPELFRKVRGRARIVRLHKFEAYGIYFAVKEDCFSVMAVFHAARNPDELWKRLK